MLMVMPRGAGGGGGLDQRSAFPRRSVQRFIFIRRSVLTECFVVLT